MSEFLLRFSAVVIRVTGHFYYRSSLDRVKAYEATFAYQKALNKRKVWVEPLFGEGKQWHGMRRFRLRRLWRVNCEALVIASGQNLKRLLRQRGWGRRPFPSEAVAIAPAAPWKQEEPIRDEKGHHQRRTMVATLITVISLTRAFLSTDLCLFPQSGLVLVLSPSPPFSVFLCHFMIVLHLFPFEGASWHLYPHAFSDKLCNDFFNRLGRFLYRFPSPSTGSEMTWHRFHCSWVLVHSCSGFAVPG